MSEPREAATEATRDAVRVAVDAMGGDHGPSEVVPGSLDFARSHPLDTVILVGDEAIIRGIAGDLPPNVRIVHASQVIGMDEQPALALREKKDATILVATDLVRRGEADAVMTAGHTGAGMAAAILRLGRLPGVDRPGLAVQMITDSGPLVLLDIGANPDSTAENLAQYARMGAIFAERVLGVADPRVALLSIGEEKGKGDARIQEATVLLDASGLRFEGNVEGKDLTKHPADVVVCDAVLGNVVIKFFEGLSGFIFDLWRAEFQGSLARAAGLPAHAPEHRPDPGRVRLREGRRLAVARREGHRDHHPRTRQAADDRLCLRGGRHDRPDPRPRAHRGIAGGRPGEPRRARNGDRHGGHRGCAAGEPQPEPRRGGGDMSGPELTVGQGVIAELVRLAAFEVPGVARVGHGGPAWRGWLAGPAVSVRVRDDRVLVRLRIVARPGQALGALDRAGPDGRGRYGRAPARPRSRCGHRHRRWSRRLIASADDGRDVDSRWPRSSRPTSGNGPQGPSSSATWPNPSAMRRPPRSPASWSMPSSPTATRSTRRSVGWPRNTR